MDAGPLRAKTSFSITIPTGEICFSFTSISTATPEPGWARITRRDGQAWWRSFSNRAENKRVPAGRSAIWTRNLRRSGGRGETRMAGDQWLRRIRLRNRRRDRHATLSWFAYGGSSAARGTLITRGRSRRERALSRDNLLPGNQSLAQRIRFSQGLSPYRKFSFGRHQAGVAYGAGRCAAGKAHLDEAGREHDLCGVHPCSRQNADRTGNETPRHLSRLSRYDPGKRLADAD